jgi:hypothetical protein
MHCHFLHHEDTGCMSVVHWQCPNQPDDQQQGPCPGLSWLVPGDVDERGTVVAKLKSNGGVQQSDSAVASWRWLQGLAHVLVAWFAVFLCM